jgi:hypothetical protein
MPDHRFGDRRIDRDRLATIYPPSAQGRAWFAAAIVAAFVAVAAIAFTAANKRTDTAAVEPDTTTGQGTRTTPPNMPTTPPATNR